MDALLHVYQYMLWLCAFGLAVGTLEYLAVVPAFANTGVYSGRITRLRMRPPGNPRLEPLLDRLFGERVVRVLLFTRLLLLALAVVFPIGSAAFSVVMGLLVVNVLAFNWRRMYGDDGSDQMNSILLLTLWLCVGPHSTALVLKLGLGFIALQACLSYATAGIAKLLSAQWRGGEAIFRIFNTAAYGIGPVARFLGRHPGFGRLLCWSVIVIECLFPLCLFLPEPWNWTFLVWGALFHLQCAVIMGLNSFLWAFLATYPALLFVSSTLTGN
jgi:hypothetical protein